MFLHRTRSGRAWSYRVDGDGFMARCTASSSPSGAAPAPRGASVSQPLRDAHGVRGEEEGGGSGVGVFVKDLRTRRVFTPSPLPMECSPERSAKAGLAGEACAPDQVGAVEGDGVAEAKGGAESSPGATDAVEEEPEKVGVLERGAEGGEDGMFQTAGSLEEGGVQGTPPDLHVISAAAAAASAADGCDVTSQLSGGSADEAFRHKQKNWSDQSQSRMGIVPCSRVKLVRDPKSFSYRRLLPFLMDLTRSSSNSLEAFPCQKQTVKIEKPIVEKSNQPSSSSPVQAKVDVPERMHKDLDPIGHRKEIMDVLELDENDTHEPLPSNSMDNILDTAGLDAEGAKLSPQLNAYEPEMTCKSLGNLPAMREGLSVVELVGGTQDSSYLPMQPKADSGMIVDGCTQLSTKTSQFGVACPLRVNHSPSTKGILKRHGGGCMGLCTCLDCASFRLHAERAFEFSRKQMQEAEDVAMGLMNELSCLRKLVESHYVIATCVTRNDIHQRGQQVKGLCRKASRAEDLARKRLREMNDDLNAHCRSTRPRVTFSESTEERIISEIDNSDAE